MPFDSVNDLQDSALFQRMESLQEMSTRQLRRFTRVFNRVHDRILRNGGDQDEAESTAVPIALNIARRAERHAEAMAGRELEDQSHYFVAHMPEQMGIRAGAPDVDNLDFSLIKRAPKVAEAFVDGNAFKHSHSETSPGEGNGEPIGQIVGIHTPDELPGSIAEHVDPDAPFVYEGKFFNDTSDDVKAKQGVSAEWKALPMGEKDFLIPDTFVITEKPFNPPTTGIKKVAERDGSMDTLTALKTLAKRVTAEPETDDGDDNPDKTEGEPSVFGQKSNDKGDAIDPSMPSNEGGPDDEPTALDRVKAELDLGDDADVEDIVVKAEQGLQAFEAVASVLDLDVEKGEAGPEDIKERVAELKTDKEKAETQASDLAERVAELEDRALDRETEAFVEEHLEGKIPTEAYAEWKTRYKNDPKGTKALAESLPEGELLGEETAEAEQLSGPDQDDLPKGLDDTIEAELDLGGDN
jgi:hypothetical protein